MNTGDEEKPLLPLPLTTRELLAAILLCSGEDIFHENELVERVAQLRQRYPGNREFSRESVHTQLRTFVIGQVLRYAGASDVFIFDRRNIAYLRRILTVSNAFPDLEGWLNEIVAATAPRATEVRT